MLPELKQTHLHTTELGDVLPKTLQKRCILLLHIGQEQVVPAAFGRFSECNQKLGLICQRETCDLLDFCVYFTLRTVLVADVFTWKKQSQL